jgi:glycosyltransferase involved in cell wall biosynthesis
MDSRLSRDAPALTEVSAEPERFQPSLGFACQWDEIPERTWSGTAWNLRAGLRLACPVTDIGAQVPALPRTVLKALYTRRRGGRLASTWEYSRLTDAYCEHILRRRLSRLLAEGRCDAVLTVQDMAILPIPFFAYQDLSYDALIAANQDLDPRASLLSIPASTVARRRERQLAVYERAAGIIAMSRWFARSLVEQTGLPPEKVHVVHAGLSAKAAVEDSGTNGTGKSGPAHIQIARHPAPRRRLLFVGRHFHRKGGDLVVAALARLRRDHDPEITLTVVGPKTWPLPGDPPAGVRFLGQLSAAEVAPLYDTHDLLVMPSRLEPFGVVFAEAIARGLPCVARDAYAMPEIVIPGQSGALVTGDDDSELAATVASVLADDALYDVCRERAPEAAEYFSWERAGREIVEVISCNLQA